MFSFLQKETHKELEPILFRMQMNAENNYRDATLSDLQELREHFEALSEAGKLNDKQKAYYSGLIDRYTIEFKGFTHKEQKTRW